MTDSAVVEQPTVRTGAGIMATAAAVTIWGAASVLVKSIDGIDGTGISFYRLLFGAILLGAVYLGSGGRFTGRMLWLCVPGGVAFGLDIVLFFSALRETSTANATVIGALQPILLLPIGVRMFGEAVDRKVVAFSFVAVAGTAVVVFAAAACRSGALTGTCSPPEPCSPGPPTSSPRSRLARSSARCSTSPD